MASKPTDMSALVAMLERRLNAERALRRQLEAELARRDSESGDARQQLAQLSERFEALLAERTQVLSLARDEAVAASRAKSSFLANMSHEIRTPLTSIIGFAELLLDPKMSAGAKSDAALTIIRNGRHLLEVINDILDLSKIETRQLEIEQIEVSLPDLLRDIRALTAARAEDKALRFTIEHHLPLPPALKTDPVRLKQILLNFCSNAIKFSSHGEVRIDVHHEAAAGRLRFDVSDTGIGMSQAQIAKLFQPFVQADVSTTREFGGTGLGLYISKQLAELLGGEIRVASEPGQGSRFTLVVPVALATRPLDLLTDPRDFDGVRRADFGITAIEVPALDGRVLLAEDGVDNQRLLTACLRQAGLEVDTVGNGRLAVERALAHEYALVLMDIQMPVMDGVAATRELRRSGYAGPIVALTANVMKSDVAHYRACGCDDVLAKPIDRARFFEVLQRYAGVAVAPDDDDADSAYRRELAALTAEFDAALPATLATIRAAAAAADWPALKALIHTLKGTAGSYGYAQISALAAEVDALLGTGRNERAAALCDELVARSRAAIGTGVAL